MTKEESARHDAFDIVVVPFPYADRLAERRRPALVISNRKLAPLGLIWVAMITSADNAPWASDVTIDDLKRAGLPAPASYPSALCRRFAWLLSPFAFSRTARYCSELLSARTALLSLQRAVHPLLTITPEKPQPFEGEGFFKTLRAHLLSFMRVTLPLLCSRNSAFQTAGKPLCRACAIAVGLLSPCASR